MNSTIVSEFVKAAGNNSPPEVEMRMTMEDSTTPGYERVDYEFVNKVKIGWKPGVNHELAMRIYDRLCCCRDYGNRVGLEACSIFNGIHNSCLCQLWRNVNGRH